MLHIMSMSIYKLFNLASMSKNDSVYVNSELLYGHLK